MAYDGAPILMLLAPRSCNGTFDEQGASMRPYDGLG